MMWVMFLNKKRCTQDSSSLQRTWSINDHASYSTTLSIWRAKPMLLTWLPPSTYLATIVCWSTSKKVFLLSTLGSYFGKCMHLVTDTCDFHSGAHSEKVERRRKKCNCLVPYLGHSSIVKVENAAAKKVRELSLKNYLKINWPLF